MDKKIEQGFKPRTWLLVILIIIALCITAVLVYKVVDYCKGGNCSFGGGFTSRMNEKKFDNRKYENVAGTSKKIFIENALEDVITNNKAGDFHKITVVYEDIETEDEEGIINIKNSLNDDEGYEVKLGYNDEKNVNRITISYVPTEEEKNTFNFNFIHESGMRPGITISHMLDDVITSNKTNKRHKITVVRNEIETQEEEEIRNIKNSFDTSTNYEVIVDYDENGFVNKVTIR